MFAFLCFLGFNIGMATAGIGSAAAVWGYAVLLAFGLAFGLCALVTAAQLSAPPHLMSVIMLDPNIQFQTHPLTPEYKVPSPVD